MTDPAQPKGHWPRGKRRNPDPDGSWEATRHSLVTLLEHHHEPGVCSLGALAKVLGCDKKTVQKWAQGVNRPGLEDQERVATWVSQQRKKIAARKKL